MSGRPIRVRISKASVATFKAPDILAFLAFFAVRNLLPPAAPSSQGLAAACVMDPVSCPRPLATPAGSRQTRARIHAGDHRHARPFCCPLWRAL